MTLIKAPWTMTRGWIYGAEIYDAEGELVATCLGKTQEESENNASLIAAAPEMLEAINIAKEMIDNHAKHWRNGSGYQKICDVIKKARGEE